MQERDPKASRPSWYYIYGAGGGGTGDVKKGPPTSLQNDDGGTVVATATMVNPLAGAAVALAMVLGNLYLESKLKEAKKAYAHRNAMRAATSSPQLASVLSPQLAAMEREGVLKTIRFRDVASLSIQFPPGHPRIDTVYVEHPLAGRLDDKRGLYIPVDDYDNLLMREREAELVKILVHLGATEILIEEGLDSETGAELEARAGVRGAGSMNVSGQSEKRETHQKQRAFKMEGRSWKATQDFDPSPFSWLPFEPDWGAIVESRLLGRCVEATITLRCTTSFSLTAKLGISGAAFTKMITGTASGEVEIQKSGDQILRVRFCESLASNE